MDWIFRCTSFTSFGCGNFLRRDWYDVVFWMWTGNSVGNMAGFLNCWTGVTESQDFFAFCMTVRKWCAWDWEKTWLGRVTQGSSVLPHLCSLHTFLLGTSLTPKHLFLLYLGLGLPNSYQRDISYQMKTCWERKKEEWGVWSHGISLPTSLLRMTRSRCPGDGWTPTCPWEQWINSFFCFACVCIVCFPYYSAFGSTHES